MITLWGRASSANVQKAVWTLEEIGQPYERIDAGGKYGGLDTPEFAAMNPNRRIPVLRDGNLTLWESHAIVRYLAARYAPGLLWPEDPVARAAVDQWTDWTATTFQPAWIGLFWLAVRTPEAKRDPAQVEKALSATAAAFRILDEQLASSAYIAGDRFTFADIVAGVSLYRWATMEIERPSLPNVDVWHGHLMDRPAFVKSVCVSYAELVARGVP